MITVAAAAAGVPAGWAAGVLISRVPGGDADRAAWSRPLFPALVTVGGFAAMGLRFGPSPVLPAYCYLVAVSVALGFIDARHHRLPDILTLTSYPAGIALLGAAAALLPNGLWSLLHAMLGGAIAGGFYLLLAAASPSALGWGDVKASVLVGMYLGWLGAPAFVAGIVAGFALAAIAGLAMIISGRATRKSHLAFGPYMFCASTAVILASPLLSKSGG